MLQGKPTIPYNIRKVSDDQYTIELAVAGFEEKDIDVELAGENPHIDPKRKMVHQGLAATIFQFVLSDDMIIKGAALSNGMLYWFT